MGQRNYVIDEEIDLRHYVKVLIQYRYWIVGLALVFTLTAFIASSLRPATYEAKALVTATQSRYELEPAAALAAMQQALQGRKNAIEAEIEPLRTEIAALQTEIATQQERLEQLIRDRDVKAETFAVISRKVQEAQIDSFSEGSNTGRVEIASPAIAPGKPLPSDRLRSTMVAGVLGLMVGVFGAFMIEWWRGQQGDEETPEGAGALKDD